MVSEESPENSETNLIAAFTKVRRMVQGYTGNVRSVSVSRRIMEIVILLFLDMRRANVPRKSQNRFLQCSQCFV